MSWLDRLKNHLAAGGQATEPTKPGSVGFVAPATADFHDSSLTLVPARLRAALPANAEALPPAVDRMCTNCLHLLRHGTCSAPVAAGLLVAEAGFGIVWPPKGHATACPALIGKMPTAAPDRPQNLTKEEAERCHAPCWDDAEIATHTARTERFELLGRADAADLAERLTLRDRDGDDRRLCLECTWLGKTGRCLAAAAGRVPGADRRHEPVQTVLQRCIAFDLRKDLV